MTSSAVGGTAPTLEYQPTTPQAAPGGSSRAGLVMGLSAHACWGLFPLYFHWLAHVPATLILGHRFVHSALAMLVIVTVTGTWGDVRRVAADRRTLGLLVVTSVLISLNWLTFIYAVTHGRALEAALGYFISPLMIAMLGVVILRESLTRVQVICVVLAAVAVGVKAYGLGALPWVSLFLPASFGVFSLLRKVGRAGSQTAMAIETFVMLPVGLAYVGHVWATADAGATGDRTAGSLALLSLSGLLTVVPLMLFGGAARRLRLVSLGFLQYVGPTIQLVIAVTLLGERFRPSDGLVFGLIWAALLLYTLDSVRRERDRRRSGRAAAGGGVVAGPGGSP